MKRQRPRRAVVHHHVAVDELRAEAAVDDGLSDDRVALGDAGGRRALPELREQLGDLRRLHVVAVADEGADDGVDALVSSAHGVIEQ